MLMKVQPSIQIENGAYDTFKQIALQKGMKVGRYIGKLITEEIERNGFSVKGGKK